MNRLLLTLVFVALVGAGLGAYYKLTRVPETPRVTELSLTTGDIVESVVATGTLQATRTVQVGTQVSGTVSKLYADYNSIVTAGEVIARIDPSVIQQQLDSAVASVDRASIDLKLEEDTLMSDKRDLNRAEDLYTRDLVTEQEREAAQLLVKQDEAVAAEDEAAITVAKAAVQQATVNLDHCVITSPIDGLVLARSVDEGQTVAASMSAPTLYLLATDLTSLELIADVDESDVGRIRPGQPTSFTVDAYPGSTFPGNVNVVRLNPTTVSNVVTYQVVIEVSNPDRRLRPGMTASMNVEISRASNVLRVPNVALRYRPSAEIFAALGETAPPAPVVATPVSVRAKPPAPISQAAAADATTIDVLFAPMVRPDTTGQVWTMADHQLKRVPLELGVTDGQWTEVISGDVNPGARLVTNIVVPASVKVTVPAPATNPLMPANRGAAGRGR